MGDSAVHADYVFLPKLLKTAGYKSHMYVLAPPPNLLTS
jgi:hypothetical protein